LGIVTTWVTTSYRAVPVSKSGRKRARDWTVVLLRGAVECLVRRSDTAGLCVKPFSHQFSREVVSDDLDPRRDCGNEPYDRRNGLDSELRTVETCWPWSLGAVWRFGPRNSIFHARNTAPRRRITVCFDFKLATRPIALSFSAKHGFMRCRMCCVRYACAASSNGSQLFSW
jgi:hypothetical protein